jgi:hypothetical protein
MGEKRGNLEKLKYDFNTAWVCEVEMGEKWYRVLEKDFRSFNGLRRLTRPLGVVLGVSDVRRETFFYEGPYYYHGTNKQYNPDVEEKGKIIYLEGQERKAAEKTSVAGL